MLIVKNAIAGCAHLERLRQHVRSFAKMMAQRRGHELPAWLEAVEADDLPELRSLAAGMRRDLTAVINGLTLEHSSAPSKATSHASSGSSATATGGQTSILSESG